MKQKGLVVAAILAGSGAASAQSAVTLYGVVDVNIEYVNHVGTVPLATNGFNRGPANNAYRMNSGGISSSRWGLRGIEDLGAGLKAVFAIEGGFDVDNGTIPPEQGGRIFGRQALVGLTSDNWGQITFGRQYASMFESLANFSPTFYSQQYEPIALMVGPNFRMDNMLKYSGQFGPIKALAHWSFGAGLALPPTSAGASPVGGSGEIPGQFRGDTAYGAAVAYGNDKFGATIGYDQWNPTDVGGTGSVRKAAIGVSYIYGPARIIGGYRWGQYKNSADSVVQRDDFYWIGANYNVTPSVNLTLAYYYDNIKNVAGDAHVANPWQISFVTNYELSKRTDLYLTTAFAKNAGLTLESQATSYATSLGLGHSYTLGNGKNTMLGVAVGLRHKF